MHVYLRGSAQQRLRLISGFVLFAFVTTHFVNHALGLVSLEAMHLMQQARMAVTRSVPGTAILAAALCTHIGLALYKLASRKTFAMPRWEAVQIGLGLAIPFLLFPHIINTRIAQAYFGVEDSYLYELVRLWPESALLQSSLLIIVWAHGCLGLHYWLRLSDIYLRLAPVLLALAIAVPVLALAGFAVAGAETSEIMSDPQALAALKMRSHWPNAEDSAVLAQLRTGARIAFLMAIAATIAIALVRWLARTLRPRAIRVTYTNGPTIDLAPGKTLLEISRSLGIPHASVCGGRGRCTTCRVRVDKGLEQLPEPTGAEAITLRSIGALPNIRLACQLRPASNLTVALVSQPATPGPPQEDFAEAKELVAAHVRALLPNELVDIQSPDDAAVRRWLAVRVPYAIALNHFSAPGFALLGARLDYLRDRPTAAIVYRRREHTVTVFAKPVEPSTSLAMRGHCNGYHVLAWTDEKLAFVAVSDLLPRELDSLERALRPSEPVLRIEATSAVI